MRKIIYAMGMSLDGYVEDADGGLDWSEPSEELHRHFNDLYLTGEIDTSLYGRRLYENMAAYWPAAAENPASGSVELEFAGAWMSQPKIVFSTSLDSVAWNSTLKREVVRDEIVALKAQSGGAIEVAGATLAATFLRLGLVDEIRQYIHPVVLGGGKPMFPVDVHLDLELVESRTFDGGVVMLRYLPADGKGSNLPGAG